MLTVTAKRRFTWRLLLLVFGMAALIATVPKDSGPRLASHVPVGITPADEHVELTPTKMRPWQSRRTIDCNSLHAPCPNRSIGDSCIDGRVCPVDCMIHQGRCQRNPYLPQHGDEATELVCVDKAPSTKPPKVSDTTDLVAAFKSATAWAFDQWWDWNATCEPRNGDGRMKLYFEQSTQEFVMENVCVSAAGPLKGYKPNVAEPFKARFEMENLKPSMLWYFNYIEGLPSAPSCFVDANVILLAEDEGSYNNVHSFHRYAQVALMQRYHFPKSDDPPHADHGPSTPRNATTLVGHIWLNDLRDGAKTRNMMKYYFPLMGDAWFSAIGSRTLARSVAEKSATSVPIKVVDASLCFRKVRIAHGCAKSHCSGRKVEQRSLETFDDLPGRRYKLAFLTPRTPYDRFVLDWLRRRFAACVGVVAKARADPVSPSVIVSYRSRNRRFAQQAANVYPLAQYMEQRYNASSVVFMEASQYAPNAVLRAHLNADVLIGPFGSTLGWVAVMPGGASLVEMVGLELGCPTERLQAVGAGVYRPAECEYAGYAAARGVRHFNHPLPPRVNDFYNVSASRWRYIVDTAMCALRWSPSHDAVVNRDARYSTHLLREQFAGLIDACERPFNESLNPSYS